MKFIEKLNLLVEGIGSTINFNSTQIGLNIGKDDSFLNFIDNAYLMKQIKFFINEEIDRFNKIFPNNKKQKIKIEFNQTKEKNESLEMVEKFIEDDKNDKAALHNFKIKYINHIVEWFKDDKNLNKDYKKHFEKELQNSNFWAFFKSERGELYLSDVTTLNNINAEIIHDLVLHLFANQEDMFYFSISDNGYGFNDPSGYSPESLLNELYALQSDHMIFYYSYEVQKPFIDVFYKDLSEIQSKNQLETVLNFFKDEKIKYLIQRQLFNEKVVYGKLLIDIFSVVEKHKQYFQNSYSFLQKHKDSQGKIVNFKRYSYPFIQNVISSIQKRQSKIPTWKDFRTYFNDYPAIQILFKKDKYLDDKKISDHPELNDINQIFYKALDSGQSLMKTSSTSGNTKRKEEIVELPNFLKRMRGKSKNDIEAAMLKIPDKEKRERLFKKYIQFQKYTNQYEIGQIGKQLVGKKEVYNFQNTIDVILDKIFKLVRSNKFTNNKIYYDMIEKKIKIEKENNP
jgi:hypothetical protein